MGKQSAAVLLTTIGTLVLAAPVLAQPPLADVARQEKARRAAIPQDERAKVYTNDDLRGGPHLTTAVTTPQPIETDPPLPTAAPPDTTPAETLTGKPDRDEACWRDRITATRPKPSSGPSSLPRPCRIAWTASGHSSRPATIRSSGRRSNRAVWMRSMSWRTPRPTSSAWIRKSGTFGKKPATPAYPPAG